MTDPVALRRATRLIASVLRGLGAALDRMAPPGARPGAGLVAIPVRRDPPRGRRPRA